MDETDVKILNLMKGNARISYQELGDAIGMSRVAARKRVAGLEKEGIIRGYNTCIRRDDETTILIDIDSKDDQTDPIIEYLNNVEGVCRILRVGDGNRLHVVMVSDSADNLRTVYREIRQNCDKYISRIRGYFVKEIIRDADERL